MRWTSAIARSPRSRAFRRWKALSFTLTGDTSITMQLRGKLSYSPAPRGCLRSLPERVFVPDYSQIRHFLTGNHVQVTILIKID